MLVILTMGEMLMLVALAAFVAFGERAVQSRVGEVMGA
jgi:hypothetical protein